MFDWIRRYFFRVRKLEVDVRELHNDNQRLRAMLNDAGAEVARQNRTIENQRAAINKRDRKLEAIVQCLDKEDFIL